MPRMNGVEFLDELRKDVKLKSAPVFVLTTSDRRQDIETAYQHNVAGYVVKPVGRDEMSDVLKKLDAYWKLCEQPENGLKTRPI